MTKVKDFLKSLGYNSLFATALFLGTVKGMAGFMNLVGFLIWVVFILIVLGYAVLVSEGEEAWRKIAEKDKEKKYPGPFSKIISAIYIATLVYYGHIFLAIIYLITVVITLEIIERVKSFQKEGCQER